MKKLALAWELGACEWHQGPLSPGWGGGGLASGAVLGSWSGMQTLREGRAVTKETSDP